MKHLGKYYAQAQVKNEIQVFLLFRFDCFYFKFSN